MEAPKRARSDGTDGQSTTLSVLPGQAFIDETFPAPPGELFIDDPGAQQPLVEAEASQVMRIWALASRFGEPLGLSSFSPEALCAALQRRGESTLLAELHVALLHSLLQNALWMRPSQMLPPHNGLCRAC